jgi:3-phenylpropionate/trans-cinnamate dioxygenase ferredoxin reductase subunit
MPATDCIVIVGAGQAGARVALGLRERGWSGRIVLIGEESLPPYERPPLSKQALTDRAFELPWIASPSQFAEHCIELRLGTRVTAIDLAGQAVHGLDAHAQPMAQHYTQLVLATGGLPRRLSIPGADDPRVHVLRRFSDAQALGPQLLAGRTLLVVGGGFIGLEVAASARRRGCEVVLLESGPRLLRRALPEDLAAQVQALHRSQGVDVRLQDGPLAIAPDGDRLCVACSSGAVVRVDRVVAGVGMVPEVSVAASAGLAVNRGIIVDPHLRSISAANVFAIGDVCEFPSTDAGCGHTVMESWQNAQAQAEVAVANLMGGTAAYGPEGWMWSDQYGHTLQMVGRCSGAAQQVSRAVPQGELQFFLDGAGRVIGAAGFAPSSALARDFLLARRIVAGGLQCDTADLAQPDVPLKRLLATRLPERVG